MSTPQAIKILDFWVTCGVEMMPSHHGWDWYPPQTASHIHIRHILSVWGIGMLSQGHMSAPLYHYTGQGCPRFWNFGSLVGWKWCHYIMVEADIHLRQSPTSVLDIAKVFWVVGMLSQGHMGAPLYHYTSKVGPRISNLGHLSRKLMPLHHGWGWHPPQTASHIQFRQ